MPLTIASRGTLATRPSEQKQVAAAAGCLRNLIHAVVKNPEHPPGVFVCRVFSFTSY